MNEMEPADGSELRRAETAQRLGVSLRTLDRYGATGRLVPVLRPADRGGSIAYYPLAEVERMRQELAAERTQRQARRAQAQEASRDRARRQVRFRLLPTQHAALVSEAQEKGLAPNDYARALTQAGLAAEWRVQLRASLETQAQQERRLQALTAELGSLRQELQTLRHGLTQALTLLAQRALFVPEARAHAWAERMTTGGTEEA